MRRPAGERHTRLPGGPALLPLSLPSLSPDETTLLPLSLPLSLTRQARPSPPLSPFLFLPQPYPGAQVDRHVELLESRAGADDPAYQHALGKLSAIMLTMRLHGVADNAAPQWPPKALPLGVSRSGLGRAHRHGAWGVDNNSIVTRTGSFDEKKPQGTPNTATVKHLRDALVRLRHAHRISVAPDLNPHPTLV